MRIPGFFRFIIKYVAPVYLIAVFVGFCWQNLPDAIKGIQASDVAQYSMILILAVAALIVAVTAIGARRWHAAGYDLNGLTLPEDEQPESVPPTARREGARI
jgi:uncharacterized membrane protein YhaH (DUF805 family)